MFPELSFMPITPGMSKARLTVSGSKLSFVMAGML